MSESPSVTRLLRALHARVRRNVVRQEVVDACLLVGASTLALTAWNATMPRSFGVAWAWIGLVAIGAIARLALRLRSSPPLWRSAQDADRARSLQDELVSAYWFSRHPETEEVRHDWVSLHLERAETTAAELDPVAIVPSLAPRRVSAAAGCFAGALAFLLLPVPRVFEPMVDRFGEMVAELGQPDEEILAELQETGNRDEDALDELLREERLRLPEEGDEELGEQNQLEEQFGEEGDELPEEPEGSFMEAEEGDQEGQEGEPQEMQVDNPEDLPESEGEQSPDPNQSEQEGQGESTEESGTTLPAGEEVFLQQGGEDMEQMELGEEEVGHATREGGEELELELGELETLEVQLQREMLATEDPPLDPETPEEDEEKEELVTKAEESRVEFRDVTRPNEAALQELLQSESVPWEYRQLVLSYFRALRERDNQKEEDEEGLRP